MGFGIISLNISVTICFYPSIKIIHNHELLYTSLLCHTTQYRINNCNCDFCFFCSHSIQRKGCCRLLCMNILDLPEHGLRRSWKVEIRNSLLNILELKYLVCELFTKDADTNETMSFIFSDVLFDSFEIEGFLRSYQNWMCLI